MAGAHGTLHLLVGLCGDHLIVATGVAVVSVVQSSDITACVLSHRYELTVLSRTGEHHCGVSVSLPFPLCKGLHASVSCGSAGASSTGHGKSVGPNCLHSRRTATRRRRRELHGWQHGSAD